MKTVEFAKATLPLSDYTKKVKKEPFIITKEGKPVAALVSITNADIETVSLSTHPRFIALIERSRAKQKAGGEFPRKKCVGGLKNQNVRHTSDNRAQTVNHQIFQLRLCWKS
jgi:antitoxin (DNA-binding transcriptional repressor) of toxin-antitoxin stability system